jgi:hypothetical protein
VHGWAFQSPSAKGNGRNCAPGVPFVNDNFTIVRVFVDGMPFPNKFNMPGDLPRQGYGSFVHETYPGQVRRDDVAMTLGRPRGRFSGFDETFDLPPQFRTPGYHTVHVIALHQCNDAFSVALQGSPAVIGINVPMELHQLGGFDPGFKMRRLAGTSPGPGYAPPGGPGTEYRAPYQYNEFCAAPGCWNHLPEGGGFYTIGNDFDCAPVAPGTPLASRQEYSNDESRERCPFEFAWTGDAGSNTAQVVVDTTHFQRPTTINNYFGVQTNTPQGGIIYGGLSLANTQHTPDFTKLVAATISVRRTVCVPSALPPQQSRFGRFLYDFTWISEGIHEVSVNVGEWSVGQTQAPEGFDTPLWVDPHGVDIALHTTATHRFLANPHANEVTVVNDCNQSAGAFMTYNIPVRDLVRRLQAEGAFNGKNPFAPGSRYLGGILGGIEQWGRSKFRSDVARHAFYVDP